MKEKSLFIAIEGLDGAGGTTHCRILKQTLESKNYKVHITQEPSSSEIGVLLRKFLKDEKVPPSTDALMFAADRSIHYFHEIKEKLNEGYIVISDRYVESSIAYQSAQTEEITVDWIKEINKFAGTPDITILLDIDPKVSMVRKGAEDLEKFEEINFLEKVRENYLSRAKSMGYHVVNSDDIIELVQEQVQNIVFKKLQ